MSKATIGVYGLGVMGRNLALNLEEKGNRVSVYNHPMPGEEDVVSDFIEEEGESKSFFGAQSLSEFVHSLKTPRKILIMVKAGPPVDSVIAELTPLLGKGDILIDGGNSHFSDTERRSESLTSKSIHFVGMGVSGGEEGARFGPSMMPGTTEKVWGQLSPIFEPIAAKAFDGSPCCSRIGTAGSGHFVKMVHNGIEYADMQLIAEAYHFMKSVLHMSADEISKQFAEWNGGALNSYLFEISSEILIVKESDGTPLVEKILDSAGQKGTGKWTAITAMESGNPLPGITASVYARYISSFIELRTTASETLKGPTYDLPHTKDELLTFLEDALLASRVVCHAEGFFMITQTDRENDWEVDPATVARIWQGGCIIRSSLLKTIVKAFENDGNIEHLFLSPLISEILAGRQDGWRKFITAAATTGIPIPVMMSSLSQYDSFRFARLPANIIQAQRDYFGAHTYERTDKPKGEFFHTNWIDK